ncbi:phosphotransferase enzyme family-domain-containing protein [Pestalotiopsis sp. NC0098]|nr:phosphotransferase enzyme family-domain-containing protein [Pestalotiopsis sp. NC0098]
MGPSENATRERSSSIKWVRTLWGLESRWTVEPDQGALMAAVQAAIPLRDPCEIKFLAQGAFNKIFTITSTNKQVVARVTLPIDPKWKTLSEVATLEWVRTNTSLPVPKVFAYSADGSTPVGFKWIAMEMMPGKPWADAYRSMTFSAKEEVVRRIARFNLEIFQRPLRGIGNIFPGGAKVQRIVSSAFIRHGFGRETVYRGPFSSSWQWVQSRLDLAELDCRGRLEKAKASMTCDRDVSECAIDPQEIQEGHNKKVKGVEKMDDPDASENDGADRDAGEKDEVEDDEDDLDVLENALKIIEKLKVHLPEFFTSPVTEPEPTILFHDDLNRHNILVDDEIGELTAVVDWECISALPLWVACRYPSFIDGKPNDIEPIKECYRHDKMAKLMSCFGNTSKTLNQRSSGASSCKKCRGWLRSGWTFSRRANAKETLIWLWTLVMTSSQYGEFWPGWRI